MNYPHSLNVCSICNCAWPDMEYQEASSDSFPEPFGETDFTVHYEAQEITSCCAGDQRQLDKLQHVQWIIDDDPKVIEFSSNDENLTALARLHIEDASLFSIIHAWFGDSPTNIFLRPIGSALLDHEYKNQCYSSGKLMDLLFEWIESILEEQVNYHDGNRDSTAYKLLLNKEKQTISVSWHL